MGRPFLGTALVPLLFLSVPAAAAEQEACLERVQRVLEDLSEDQSLRARLRDQLAEAAEMCRAGRTQEAAALLRELQGQWMPMGPGN